ncbi:16S rRNA (uracil(1498)-N(3))-methyltransferase [Limibacter armeniacum]|uniref:16S rRNA (uracil(1498)-N(3))-methyltransferase n=1 Tax=Limibacter armeniacum TaxID=466084 RepID=UPI002FE570BB
MRIFYHPDLNENLTSVELNADDSRHVAKVLRLKAGDSVLLTDGKGGQYEAEITKPDPKKSQLKIVHYEYESKLGGYGIHIAVAPTKNMDRIEYFVEKAVELGIDRITFIKTNNSERTVVKTERVKKIAVSAMKQSQKSYLPEIDEMVSLKSFLSSCDDDEKYICYVPEDPDKHLFKEAAPSKKYCVLIGPEGGFTPEEVAMATESGFEAVSLGKSRLRTETAALAACHILNLKNI